MRPKKRILLVSASEMQLSICAMMLRTHGYRVFAVTGADEACAIAVVQPIDLAVIDRALLAEADGDALVLKIKAIHADVSTLLLDQTRKPGEVAHNADTLLGAGWTPHELRSLAKTMTARRRGPRKQVMSIASSELQEHCA
jgi:response regulator RpfG family c-di-GMP phosphodiesterase